MPSLRCGLRPPLGVAGDARRADARRDSGLLVLRQALTPHQSLPALLDEVRGCTICAAALPDGVRPVFRLHPDARILVAGQAPGRRVHASGIPFDDPSGDRLREWMGLTRDTFYDEHQIAILPMGFCYPGTGKSGDLPPRRECAPAWRAKLIARLPRLELTLAIGQYAIAYHLPDGPAAVTDAVRAWRAAWPSTIALPHPSPRNNIWLSKNLWFEREVVPALRDRIAEILVR